MLHHCNTTPRHHATTLGTFSPWCGLAEEPRYQMPTWPCWLPPPHERLTATQVSALHNHQTGNFDIFISVKETTIFFLSHTLSHTELCWPYCYKKGQLFLVHRQAEEETPTIKLLLLSDVNYRDSFDNTVFNSMKLWAILHWLKVARTPENATSMYSSWYNSVRRYFKLLFLIFTTLNLIMLGKKKNHNLTIFHLSYLQKITKLRVHMNSIFTWWPGILDWPKIKFFH